MMQEQQPKLGFFDFQFGRSYYSKLLLILLLEVIVFVSAGEIIKIYKYYIMETSISIICIALCVIYFSLYITSYIRESKILAKIYKKFHFSFKFYDKDNHQVSLKTMVIILTIKITLFLSLCFFSIETLDFSLHWSELTRDNSLTLSLFGALEFVRFREDHEILLKVVFFLQFGLFIFTVYIFERLYKMGNRKKAFAIGLILLLLSNPLTLNIITDIIIPYQCTEIIEKESTYTGKTFISDKFESRFSNSDYQHCKKLAFTNNPYILANLIISTLEEIRKVESREYARKFLGKKSSMKDDDLSRERIFDMIYFNEKLKLSPYIKSAEKISDEVSRYTEIYPWRYDYYYWRDLNDTSWAVVFHNLRDKENKSPDDILKLGDIYFSLGEYDIAEQYYLQHKQPEVIAEKLKDIKVQRNKLNDNTPEKFKKRIYDIISKPDSRWDRYTMNNLAKVYFESALKLPYSRAENLYLSILYAIEAIKNNNMSYDTIKLIRDFVIQYNFDDRDGSLRGINEKLRKNDFNKLVEMYLNKDPLTKKFAEYYQSYLKFTFRYDNLSDYLSKMHEAPDPRYWYDDIDCTLSSYYDPNARIKAGEIAFYNDDVFSLLDSNPYATELVKAMEEEREKVKNSLRYEVLLKLQNEGIQYTYGGHLDMSRCSQQKR
ncbi:hypothetical protein Q7Z74_11400 [Glaesserella parasuis]|nr:hypothetical protein [Glaesserella parasuis]MDP0307893.1 hypothetical protein [Glaesserella parasuis]MDP0472677.1 hypothetical protein [Glaesserella parasuis]